MEFYSALRRYRWPFPLLLAGLAFLVFLLYIPALYDDFVGIDDGLLVTGNAAVQQLSISSLFHVFTSYDPELYIPLTFVSYQIEHAIFGLSPFIFHFTNVLLHVVSTLLVCICALSLSRGRKSVALVCAVLFAVHPLQVQIVSWVSARKDLLSGCFFLASLAVYLHQGRERFNRLWIGSLALFFLGLLAKVTVAPLPAILFLADWREGKHWRENVLSVVPFFLLSAVFLLIAVIGKRAHIGILTLAQQGFLFGKSLAFALWKLLLPIRLSVFYHQATPMTLASWEFLLPAAIFVVFVAFIVLAWSRDWRTPVFALSFFLLTFLPTVGAFTKDHWIFFFSDRYAYLPSIGVFFLIAIVWGDLLEYGGAAARRVSFLALTALIATYGTLTLLQERTWQSSEALFRNAIAVTPSSSLAYAELGMELLRQERNDEAEAALRKAIVLDPLNAAPLTRLGERYKNQGRLPEAEQLLRTAVKLTEDIPIYSMLDFAPYYHLGEILIAKGQTEKGLGEFRRAVERGPGFAETHYNLALKSEQFGLLEKAKIEYERAIALYDIPTAEQLSAYYRYAGILESQGFTLQAAEQLRHIVAIRPLYKDAEARLQRLERLLGASNGSGRRQ